MPGTVRISIMDHSAEIRVGRRACSQFTQGRPHGLVVFARPVKRPPELSTSPVARPFPRLAEAWRQVHGHAAAAGSEDIEHGRLPSGCTSGGRLPPLGRSNDRSPPTEMPPYPPHRAHPHVRYRPCGALPVWVLLSTTILCSGVCQPLICSRRPVPPSGLSSHHTPCRCVGPLPPGHTAGLGRCEVV